MSTVNVGIAYAVLSALVFGVYLFVMKRVVTESRRRSFLLLRQTPPPLPPLSKRHQRTPPSSSRRGRTASIRSRRYSL
ncbi:hypothetical protein C8039_12925 [Halogeometricum sp. wsp3]|nr:hypothetical protein C8039_12925 [Halogeometricum sp. wsp3]